MSENIILFLFNDKHMNPIQEHKNTTLQSHDPNLLPCNTTMTNLRFSNLQRCRKKSRGAKRSPRGCVIAESCVGIHVQS